MMCKVHICSYTQTQNTSISLCYNMSNGGCENSLHFVAYCLARKRLGTHPIETVAVSTIQITIYNLLT